MPNFKLFHDVVRERHTVRNFHSEAVTNAVLRSVLDDGRARRIDPLVRAAFVADVSFDAGAT